MPWNEGMTAGSPAFSIAVSQNTRIRVIAGPGTGKSFAMKRRVARLLEADVAPNKILPVTFTRVASEDLHRELVGLGVPGCEQLEGTTLHSLSLRMLMRNHVLQATGRNPRPLNKFEVDPLVCDLAREHGGKDKVNDLLRAYEAAWARLQHETPGYVQNQADASFSHDLVAWMHFHNAMLIGEVVPQLYQYLRQNPGAPERNEFHHILVDEFQDLNKVDQGVIALLAGSADVCIVGDDDQSIYSFRYAWPAGIREWLTLNPGADDLAIADCRRCPTTIVAMANSLIAHNIDRPLPHTLAPHADNGPGIVQTIQYQTLAAEVAGVANIVAELVTAGAPPGDILILAQRDVIGTPIFDALRARGVPAKSYYAEAELAPSEAQYQFALLKLLVDRHDRVALRWLVGYGGHQWQAAGYARVRAYSENNNIEPWEALQRLGSGQISLQYTGGIVAAFGEVAAKIGLLEQLPDLASVVEDLFPAGNLAVAQLRDLALSTLAVIPSEDGAELLFQLVQAIAKPEIPTEVHEVRIMSLHKSKGLSAPVTIISGCIQGLLPKRSKAGTSAEDAAAILEEQRRLFFVGITRVKAIPAQGIPGTLILTSSRRMPLQTARHAGIDPAGVYYGTAKLLASQFLNELGPGAPQPVAG